MASLYGKLAVLVGFTLALLLIASNGEETSSFGGSALCDSSTGIACTSDESCVTICKQRAGKNYVDGYCSTDPHNVVGNGGRSCVCAERCSAQSTPPPPETKPAMAKQAWGGMGMLD